MTAFPWTIASDEIEDAARAGEPSHVHIPRPSRRSASQVAETSFEKVTLEPIGCACRDN
jgi:hypothetical protein